MTFERFGFEWRRGDDARLPPFRTCCEIHSRLQVEDPLCVTPKRTRRSANVDLDAVLAREHGPSGDAKASGVMLGSWTTRGEGNAERNELVDVGRLFPAIDRIVREVHLIAGSHPKIGDERSEVSDFIVP